MASCVIETKTLDTKSYYRNIESGIRTCMPKALLFVQGQSAEIVEGVMNQVCEDIEIIYMATNPDRMYLSKHNVKK